MLENMNEIANRSVNGNFFAEITEIENGFHVSVKHFKSEEDPCAGQSQVVSELYKVLGALELETENGKRGDVAHSGGCASVFARKEKADDYLLGGFSVRMTKSQASRWNSADLTAEDMENITVFIPVKNNHYKSVRLSEMPGKDLEFMEGFVAELDFQKV
jgi:uncharacterized protein YceK